MKKTIVIFILLPFLYFSVGYYPFFLLRQQLIKNEIKQKIKNDQSLCELTEIIIDLKDFNAIKHISESEILYNDHLYDIVRTEKDKNNQLHLFCIDDKKENSLLAQLNEQSQTNEKNKQNSEELFFKTFFKDYLKVRALFFKSNDHIIICFSEISIIYKSCFTDNPSPPPKQLV